MECLTKLQQENDMLRAQVLELEKTKKNKKEKKEGRENKEKKEKTHENL